MAGKGSKPGVPRDPYKKSKKVDLGITVVTCPRCSQRVDKSNATGQILAHYKGDGKTWCK